MSQPPRKRLRRGTRSCLECRQRKVRCIFESGDGKPPCDGCIDRQTSCVGQENAPDSDQPHETIRDRLGRMEAAVQSLNNAVTWLRSVEEARLPVNAIPANQPSTLGDSIGGLVERSNSTDGDDGAHDDADQSDEDNTHIPGTEPAYLKSLFNNHVLSSAPKVPNATPSPAAEAGKIMWEGCARTRVSSLVPSRDEVLIVTAAAADWWSIHNAVLPSPSIGSKQSLIDGHGQLHCSSTHPAAIATWLVCLAITLLQLPQDFDPAVLHSINNPRDFVQRTVKEIDQFLSSDLPMRTLEGIECATVFAKLATYLGRPKKGWLVLRRAVAFAELLNLHCSRRALKQLQTRQHPLPDKVAHLQARAALWESLGGLDRFLSVLLHLPVATSNTILPVEAHPDNPNTRLQQMMWAQSEIANRLCHRDQLESETDAYEETRKIIQDLLALEETRPKEWWSLDRSAVYDIKTATSVLLQMSHRYLLVRALLPYLLKAKGDVRYQPNATACMHACRDVLRRYFAVRTCLAAGVFLSRTFEIQVFIACVVLLLHRDRLSWYLPLTDSWESDAALLESAKLAIEKAPAGITGSFTQRMVSALNQIQRCLDAAADSPSVVQLRVPLLGTISVCRSTPDRESSTEHEAMACNALLSLSTPDSYALDETFLDFPFDVDFPDEELTF